MVEASTRKSQTGAATRWSPILAGGGFTPVVSSFIEHCGRPASRGGLGLNPSQAMTVVQLMSYKRDEKMVYPGVKTIAARMGLTEQTVRANLNALVKKKLLEKRLRRGTTALYDLTPLLRRLEEVQAKAEARKARAKREAEAMLLPEHHRPDGSPNPAAEPADG